ncbi:MAG: ABC transporter substrate-binding protein [Burkholderiales bacterium]|nr:MAG: ABC transporter substrate-binding protein [Burkholderiales bacterium]
MKRNIGSARCVGMRTLGAAALAAVVWSAPAGAETLVVAATRTPGGFDGDALKPNTQNVVVQMYEGLTRYGYKKNQQPGRMEIDPSQVLPHLAESWTVSPDGKTYTFKLRQGVKSPYGNELTSADVVWGWEKSRAQKRTGAFIARVSSVQSFEAVDKYTVRFQLEAPSKIFLSALTLYVPGIYDSTEVRKHVTDDDPWALKWIDRNTAGFGAYHLESLRAGEAAVFVANPNYFGGKPYYDRVVYREVPNAGTRFTLVRTGQAQWTEELTLKQINELKKDQRVKVESDVGTGHASARINMTIAPFDNVKLRQAIAYAADYDAINKAVFEGLGTQARSIVPPIIPGTDTSKWTYATDPDKARQLLKEAGYPDGIDITLEYSAIFWFEEPLAIQLKDALGKAGIRVNLQKITNADMRSRTAPNKRDLPFFTFMDNPIVLDPVYALYLNAHSKGASNRNNYSNPEFDRLVDAARVEQDDAKRLELVKQAQQLHTTDSTWVMTMYPGAHEPMPPCMTGYVWQPDYHERWRELSCGK